MLETLPRFPCSIDKIPLVRWSSGARIDVDDRAWPLVGVPTGSASGLDVLDIDVKGMAWLAANIDRLPQTRTHVTRSGGRHLLFKHADGLRNSVRRIAPGVDVRADGGLIVWWPREGYKAWDFEIVGWPEWLLAIAGTVITVVGLGVAVRRETPIRKGHGGGRAGVRERRYAQAALRNAFDKLANRWPRDRDGNPVEGGRNDLLNRLGFKMGGLVANGWIDGAVVVGVLMAAAADCGLVREDGEAQCRATILSGLKAGMQRPYPPLRRWEDSRT